MQFVRYTAGGPPEWGVRRDDAVVPLSGARESFSQAKLTDPGYLRTVGAAVDAAADRARPVEEVRLLAPVPRPGKIVCVGLNYHDHAEEQGEAPPDRPLLFGKAPTAVTNPGDPIVHPDGVEQVDYEVELAVVIGRTASDVDAADARDHVAGYTVLNDVSARDAQFDDGQFFRGKSYDTFAPVGPTLVPDLRADPDGIDPAALDVACRVNGETRQSSTTAEFVFDVPELVEYVSHAMTLRPGDVIATGTPGGVGIFREPPELLEPGDEVVAEVEGIGALGNPVVAE